MIYRDIDFYIPLCHKYHPMTSRSGGLHKKCFTGSSSICLSVFKSIHGQPSDKPKNKDILKFRFEESLF